MWDFSFLAIPNIEGMRLWWYIQLFGIVALFGVCLFFVIYFRLLYRRKQQLIHHMHDVDQQTQDLGKDMLRHKIKQSSDATKLILFIEYLEKFVTTKPYANISELLSLQWFTPDDIQACEHILYADGKLSKHLEMKIDKSFAIKW